MINRQNWLDVSAYLIYSRRQRQTEVRTVQRYRTHLSHVLIWADEKLLVNARSFDPTFPAYLVGRGFSPATLAKTLEVARRFFDFARNEWPTRYKGLSESWIESLQPPKSSGLQSRLKEHEHYQLEDVLKIAALPVETLREKRDRAAACFLFLSAMRVDAFASLPISCIDLERNEILQLPERGVRTKNSKAARTHLLEIPELLEVVREWDSIVRKELSPAALWFSVMNRDGQQLTGGTKAHARRGQDVAEALIRLCERANIPYLSPHKLRHGHIVYALQNVSDMAGLKAISQNVMHSSVVTTDSIYGNLDGSKIHQVYAGMSKSKQPSQAQSSDSDIEGAAKLLELLRDHPNLINSLTGKK